MAADFSGTEESLRDMPDRPCEIPLVAKKTPVTVYEVAGRGSGQVNV